MSNGDHDYHGFEEHAGDDDWKEEGEQLYEEILDYMLEEYGDQVELNGYSREEMADVMYDLWFNETISDRDDLRFMWYDMGFTDDDFPWDDWRDWYES